MDRNKDKWAEYYREYFRNNNEQRVKNIARNSYNNAKRRAIKYNRPIATDPIEIEMMKKIYLAVAQANASAGETKYSVDHIRELGTDDKSSHTYDNLAILSLSENTKKSHRIRKEIRPQPQFNKETR